MLIKAWATIKRRNARKQRGKLQESIREASFRQKEASQIAIYSVTGLGSQGQVEK